MAHANPGPSRVAGHQGRAAILFLSLNLVIQVSHALVANAISSDTLDQGFHVAWTTSAPNETRYDFIFNPRAPLKNAIHLNTVAAGSIPEQSLTHCSGYAACLLRNGSFQYAYKLLEDHDKHSQVFLLESHAYKHIAGGDNTTKQLQMTTESDIDSDCDITVNHYCSTHWNPAQHLYTNGCNQMIEWHSPYSCANNTTNYQQPCFIYNPQGKLIDLTPWILSNGTAYDVDTSVLNTTMSFKLAVCNEATHECGPNVASCYSKESGHIESGYNNLTSIKYERESSSVLLETLGQYDDTCPGKRTKTTVKFLCKNNTVKSTGPKLKQFSRCDSQIEWQTIHACPLSDIRAPATACGLKHAPTDVDIDIRKITSNQTYVEVEGFNLDGKQMKMVLGLCQGIDTSLIKCAGKSTKSTTACLIDQTNSTASKDHERTKSTIVGSMSKSYVRLSDNRLYLESFAANKTCQVSHKKGFNATRQVGTRIEFFCSPDASGLEKPSFLGYDDCIYIFEWPSKLMCLESLKHPKQTTNIIDNTNKNVINKPTNQPKHIEQPVATPTSVTKPTSESAVNVTRLSDDKLKINLDKKAKSGQELHKETLDDATQYIKSTDGDATMSQKDDLQGGGSTSQPLTNIEKFFMIGLIFISFVAFIVGIFVLEKRTTLGLSLVGLRRQARQAFQPEQNPYTRVDNYNHSLDL